jgi:hypothetical protein
VQEQGTSPEVRLVESVELYLSIIALDTQEIIRCVQQQRRGDPSEPLQEHIHCYSSRGHIEQRRA